MLQTNQKNKISEIEENFKFELASLKEKTEAQKYELLEKTKSQKEEIKKCYGNLLIKDKKIQDLNDKIGNCYIYNIRFNNKRARKPIK